MWKIRTRSPWQSLSLEHQLCRSLSTSVPNRIAGLEDPLGHDEEPVEVSFTVGSAVARHAALCARHRAVECVSFSPQKCSPHLDDAVLRIAHAQAQQSAEQDVERFAEDGDASEL
jgi:hypothetical protein